MSKITQAERNSALKIAAQIVEYDRRRDVVLRDVMRPAFFGEVGYWVQRRKPTTGECRGERCPPKAWRLPHGGTTRNEWTAISDWASTAAAEGISVNL